MNIYYPIVSMGQEFRNCFLSVSGTGFLIAVMISARDAAVWRLEWAAGSPLKKVAHSHGWQFFFGKRPQYFLGGPLHGLLECPHDMVAEFP